MDIPSKQSELWPLKSEASSRLYWEDCLFNPFVPNASFLYPLNTSENRKVFWCIQGVEKGCIGNEWVHCIFLLVNSEYLRRICSDYWKKQLCKLINCKSSCSKRKLMLKFDGRKFISKIRYKPILSQWNSLFFLQFT